MPRYAAKKDGNHRLVVQPALDIGATVIDTSGAPGLLDCIIGFRGRLTWFEIKARGKRHELTPRERETIAALERVNAPVFVVETSDEVLRAIGAIS